MEFSSSQSFLRCSCFPLEGDEFLVLRGVQAKLEWPLGGDVVEEIKISDSWERKLFDEGLSNFKNELLQESCKHT